MRPHTASTRLVLDDATLDKLADRIADRVVARMSAPKPEAEAALAQAAMGNGNVSLSPELMRGLVRMVMNNLAEPDTGAVVDNLRTLGVLESDGGLPLQHDTVRKP
jgi:hypothetical protein